MGDRGGNALLRVQDPVRASSDCRFRPVLTVTPGRYLRAKIGEDRDVWTSEKKCGQYVLLHKALHQQKPDGTSSKHSDNEQDDHYWCETQHGNQSGMRHELSQPQPQRNLAHDRRNEHEGKQTKTEGWMIATWKAGRRFNTNYVLVSFLPTYNGIL